MKALTWHGGPRLTYDDIPAPAAGDGDVAVDVTLAGVCGSDLHPYRGHAGPRVPPLVLGHEAVGRVAGRPDTGYVVFPLVVCGSCAACLRGEENLCESRGLLGLDRQGVFAERVMVRPDALVPIPDRMDERVAVLTEPLATSVAVMRVDGITAADRVLVVGGGPIGLLAAHACAAGGIDVTLVEPLAERRALAERIGAAVHAAVEDVRGARFDRAIDAVGIEPTWQGAVAAVRAGGTVTIVGLGQAEGAIAAGDMVRRGITVRGHYAYTRADFAAALRVLAEHPPDLEWVSVMPLADGAEAFRRLVDEPATTVKALLRVGG